MFGSSENITLTAGVVLGVLYGGKTATGVNPRGTSVRAIARVCGIVAPAPTSEVDAPPPGAPGTGFPMKRKQTLFNKKTSTFEESLHVPISV